MNYYSNNIKNSQSTQEETKLLHPLKPTTIGSNEPYTNENTSSLNYSCIRETYIYTLINSVLPLIKPIPVKLTYYYNEVIGEIEELELYSFGTGDNEVLQELNEDFVELFYALKDHNDDELGRFPIQWKSKLQEYIQFD